MRKNKIRNRNQLSVRLSTTTTWWVVGTSLGLVTLFLVLLIANFGIPKNGFTDDADGEDNNIFLKYTFEDRIDKADIGPDAISVGSYAYLDSMDGSLAINPGQVTQQNGNTGINLELPASTFYRDGFDFSLDFRALDEHCDFLSIGTSFIFGIQAGKLKVQYKIDNNGSVHNHNVNGIYNIQYPPKQGNSYTVYGDLVNYRFVYDPETGYAHVEIDSDTVWSNFHAQGATLYWGGNTANAIVGKTMTGEGYQVPVMDNLIVKSMSGSGSLPVEYAYLNADLEGEGVKVSWATNQEINARNFFVQLSKDGSDFEDIVEMPAMGGMNKGSEYAVFDDNPFPGRNIYRLRQMDMDGTENLSQTVTIMFDQSGASKENLSGMMVYPNPVKSGNPFSLALDCKDEMNMDVQVVGVNGQVYFDGEFEAGQGSNSWSLNPGSLSPGMYFVTASHRTGKDSKPVVIFE